VKSFNLRQLEKFDLLGLAMQVFIANDRITKIRLGFKAWIHSFWIFFWKTWMASWNFEAKTTGKMSCFKKETFSGINN